MAFSNSIAGRVSSLLWQNPIVGLGVSFGTGAGAFSAFATGTETEGSAQTKIDAGLSSGAAWMLGGTAAFAGGLTATSYLPQRAVGLAAGRMTGKAFAGIRNYPGAIARDFKAGGLARVGERKGLAIGLGAAVGAAIGSQVSDDSGRGARIGAVVGAGSGLATSVLIRGSRGWNSMGGFGRFGTIAALSVGVGAGVSALQGPEYETVDVAQPEDNGLRDRMSRIGATGDLVLGLHRKR